MKLILLTLVGSVALVAAAPLIILPPAYKPSAANEAGFLLRLSGEIADRLNYMNNIVKEVSPRPVIKTIKTSPITKKAVSVVTNFLTLRWAAPSPIDMVTSSTTDTPSSYKADDIPDYLARPWGPLGLDKPGKEGQNTGLTKGLNDTQDQDVGTLPEPKK